MSYGEEVSETNKFHSNCNMHSLHRLNMFNICGELFQNPLRGSRVMKSTWFVINRQLEPKNNTSHIYIITVTQQSTCSWNEKRHTVENYGVVFLKFTTYLTISRSNKYQPVYSAAFVLFLT